MFFFRVAFLGIGQQKKIEQILEVPSAMAWLLATPPPLGFLAVMAGPSAGRLRSVPRPPRRASRLFQTLLQIGRRSPGVGGGAVRVPPELPQKHPAPQPRRSLPNSQRSEPLASPASCASPAPCPGLACGFLRAEAAGISTSRVENPRGGDGERGKHQNIQGPKG